MSTDPSAITTEIPITEAATASVDDARPDLARLAGTQPGPAHAPVGLAAQPTGVPADGVEPCPHCGTPLALDQRYCLECGAPRTYLSGMLLERLRSPTAAQADGATTPPQPPGFSAGPAGGPPGALGSSAASGGAWQRGGVLTLIASVGVLLLAMGVGVLIGRSGESSGSGGSAPQVVTVAPATGAASTTATTPTTSETASTPAAKAAAPATAAGAAAKHKAAGSGVGSVPSKPAPPSVLNNLRKGSGQSYEQKSKNLPNVVSTG